MGEKRGDGSGGGSGRVGSEEGFLGSEMGLDLDEALNLSMDLWEGRRAGFGFGFNFGSGFGSKGFGCGCGGGRGGRCREGLVCLGGVAEI